MSWILRILLLLLLIALVWRVVARAWRGLTGGASRAPAAAALVRDPVCGTYVLPSRAVVVQSGSTRTYFCSDRCRRAWQRRPA